MPNTIKTVHIDVSTLEKCLQNKELIKAAISQIFVSNKEKEINKKSSFRNSTKTNKYRIEYNNKPIFVTFSHSIKKIWNVERQRYLYYIKIHTPNNKQKGAFGSKETYDEHCIDLENPAFAIPNPTTKIIGKKIKTLDLTSNLLKQEQTTKKEADIAKILYPETQYCHTIKKTTENRTATISLFFMPNLGDQNLYECKKTEQFKNLNFLDRINNILHIAIQIQRLHKAGYVHQDLKSQNVVYDSQTGKMSLIDFGVTKNIGNTDPYQGTREYAPPEGFVSRLPLQITSDTFSQSAVSAEILGAPIDEIIAERKNTLFDCTKKPFDFNCLPRDLLYRDEIINFLKEMGAIDKNKRPSDEAIIKFFFDLKYREIIKTLTPPTKNKPTTADLDTDEKKKSFYSLFILDCAPNDIDTNSLKYKIYETILEKRKNSDLALEIFFETIKPYMTCPYLRYLEEYVFTMIEEEAERLEKDNNPKNNKGLEKANALRAEANSLKITIINAVTANKKISSLTEDIKIAVRAQLKTIIETPAINKNREEVKAFLKKLLGAFLAIPLLGIPLIFAAYRYRFFYNETQNGLWQIKNDNEGFPAKLEEQKNIILML